MLTTDKLIEWLSKFPSGTPVYYMEDNTGNWQHLPSIDSTFSKMFFRNKADEMASTKEWYEHWFRDTENKEQRIKDEFAHTFEYVDSDDGVFIRL